MTKRLMVGDVAVGGGAPVYYSIHVQYQDRRCPTPLWSRSTRWRPPDARSSALPFRIRPRQMAVDRIKEQISIPLIADIHFNYKHGAWRAQSGASTPLRINPGNIGGEEKVKAVAEASAAKNRIPIRIGVNGGFSGKGACGPNTAASRQRHWWRAPWATWHLLNKFDFDDICISVKCSDVPLTMAAYRLLERADRLPFALWA